MANSVNLPAPYGGVNEKVPIAVLQSPFCENLLNFNITQAGIVLRHGDSKYKLLTPANASTPFTIVEYGTSKLFVAAYNATTTRVDIYDVDAGTVSYSSAALGTDDFYTLYFNNYLFFFSSSTYAPGVVWNGAAFGVIGYSGSGFLPKGGNGFNHRAYIIQSGESAYWYSELDAITGACTKVDLTGIVSEKCTLAHIASFTLSDNVSAINVQSFVFDTGEVLFYTGAYPDGADWTLLGTSRISQPINVNSSIKYGSDSLIMCDTGLISLKQLFLKGNEDSANFTTNTETEETWRDLVQAIRTTNSIPVGSLGNSFRGVWDTKTDRIVISFPNYLVPGAALGVGAFFFVFHSPIQAWFFHRSTGTFGQSCRGMARYKNKILLLMFGASKIMIQEKEGATGFTDRDPDDTQDVVYTYELLSAPVPFPKTAVYEATQIEPIIESDLYAQINWNFVVDFGRQTTGDQKTDGGSTSVAKPAVNVGAQNITFVQVKMSGITAASKTIGLNLFSYNIWYNAGEIASR